jgi:hypothetical protein
MRAVSVKPSTRLCECRVKRDKNNQAHDVGDSVLDIFTTDIYVNALPPDFAGL